MPERSISVMSAEDMVRTGADVSSINVWVDHQARGDWFTSRLFRLWQTADSRNRTRLLQGFPEEVTIFEA